MNPSSLPDTDLLSRAALENLVVHMSWLQGRTPGMTVDDADGLVVIDSGLPCDTFNIICGARLSPGGEARRIALALAHFTMVQRPFSWWVGPADAPGSLGDLLLAAGLVATETEVAMYAPLAALEPPAPNVRIARACGAETIQDFADVVADNWSPADPWVRRFYAACRPALQDAASPLRLFVGYLGDEPVAAGELTLGGGVAGLYNISTRAAHRRRGFGAAMVGHLLAEARDAGCDTAILQAAPDGLGLYARAGFRPAGTYTEYRLPEA